MSSREVPLGALSEFPPTVEDHTIRGNGATLHTIDPDPKRDIEVYSDDTEMHYTGDPPEDEK